MLFGATSRVFKVLKVEVEETKSSAVVTDVDAIRRKSGISSDGLVIVAAILGNEYDGNDGSKRGTGAHQTGLKGALPVVRCLERRMATRLTRRGGGGGSGGGGSATSVVGDEEGEEEDEDEEEEEGVRGVVKLLIDYLELTDKDDAEWAEYMASFNVDRHPLLNLRKVLIPHSFSFSFSSSSSFSSS